MAKMTLKEKTQAKLASVLHDFGQNKLKSSSGKAVTNQKMAVAIALSEASKIKNIKKKK